MWFEQLFIVVQGFIVLCKFIVNRIAAAAPNMLHNKLHKYANLDHMWNFVPTSATSSQM